MPIPRNVYETLLNRNHFVLPAILSIALTAASAFAQSSARDLAGMVDAALDGAREKREQEAAPADIRAVFAKAVEAEEDGNINFCGFYIGMAKSDADALVSHYGLKPGESTIAGNPAYDIRLSLQGVRRVTKGGNSFDELCQAVANRTGDLKHKYDGGGWEEKAETWYEYKTIDGVRLTMSEESLKRTGIVAGFRLWDGTGKIKAEAERKKAADLQRRRPQGRHGKIKAEAERKKAEEEKEKRLAKLRDSLPQMVDGIVASMIPISGKDYRMGKYEVTQSQWEAVMGETPSRFKGADNPVENVSWNDCQEFLKKLNALPEVKASGLVFRLPSEKEWEYACRAGATGDYCKLADGSEISSKTLGKVAWFNANSNGKTHPVGQKEPNAFGLYDMHGNVWEWTQTAVGVGRVNRGGGWLYSAEFCESSNRGKNSPDNRNRSIGFRLCASGRADEAPLAGTASKPSAQASRAERGGEGGRATRDWIADMVPVPGENFSIGKYEVTQSQWEAVMGTNPSRFKGADNPVENVSWNDCQEFLKKLNALPEVKASGLVFRLPTNAEWECACRAGAPGKYCKLADGTEITEDTLGRVAWFTDNSDYTTHPVGQKEPNAFGLYDMHGNVWEWTQTADGEARVNRGGCWLDSARYCESSFRAGLSPVNRNGSLGFRLCASGRAD